MPARMSVVLQHLDGPEPPPQTGPALHGALFGLLGDLDRADSETLHKPRSHQAFSLSGLEREASPGRYAFEVGVLIDEAVPIFEKILRNGLIQIGAGVSRRGRPAAVEGRRSRESAKFAVVDVRPAIAGHPELLVRYRDLLGSGTACDHWRLRFVSPTTFRTSRGVGVRRSMPLPSAGLVFRSLFTRWQSYAPTVALPRDTARTLADHLAISRIRTLRTEPCLTKVSEGTGASHYEIGFVGDVEYALVGGRLVSEQVRKAISALAQFAEFGGVGDQTPKGMGCVRPVAPRRR